MMSRKIEPRLNCWPKREVADCTSQYCSLEERDRKISKNGSKITIPHLRRRNITTSSINTLSATYDRNTQLDDVPTTNVRLLPTLLHPPTQPHNARPPTGTLVLLPNTVLPLSLHLPHLPLLPAHRPLRQHSNKAQPQTVRHQTRPRPPCSASKRLNSRVAPTHGWTSDELLRLVADGR